MSNPKIDAFNDFVRAGVRLADHLKTANEMHDREAQEGFMRRATELQLEVIRAAFAQNDVASNSEADSVIGEVLLERVSNAISTRSKTDWEELAQTALTDLSRSTDVLSPAVKQLLNESGPVIELALEGRARGVAQNHEAMIEGFRRGAAQTPGFELRITEIDGDTVVSDEYILGPTSGEEDSPERKVDTLNLTKQQNLGLDDERTQAAVERVSTNQGQTIASRLGGSNPSSDMLRLLVAQHALNEAYRDLSISEVIADLPTPIAGLGTEHLPALRGQVLNAQALLLNEGTTYSRIQRGDSSAWPMMFQIIFATGMFAFAEPYFLPLDEIPAGSRSGSATRELPADRTYLIWHDDPVVICDGIRVIAWVFSTDGNGQVEEVAHAVLTHGEKAFEVCWVSLRAGRAAHAARAVASTLTTRTWNMAKRLRLPEDPDSAGWKKALMRSRGKARRGGAQGLYTLAD